MHVALAAQRDRALLILRLAALVGLAIAGYLLYLALAGQAAPGCGEGEGGCGDVLASRWSEVLGVPVSAFAVAAYVVLLAASIHAGPNSPPRHREGAWRLMAFVGFAAGLASLWFIGLQWFEVERVCFYCMSAHACSLVIALVALLKSSGWLRFAGVLPVGGLIALQLFVIPPPPSFDPDAVVFGNFDTRAAPVLGDPDAPNVVALLFDYNCAFCREAHRTAADAVERYAGQLVVVLLPTALDPACNKGAAAPGAHSATSCELARLSLAVWLADPDHFGGYDAELVEHAESYPDIHATPDQYVLQARLLAERRVGKDALADALADPRIDEILETNGEIYKNAKYDGRRGVPRLIVTGRALPGIAEPQSFFDLLERAYPGLSESPK
ncbi:MAG: vitamin K epoxide reductase family protein [Phycisphaeraceae bacterium]